MRARLSVLILLVLIAISCDGNRAERARGANTNRAVNTQHEQRRVTADIARDIAMRDAARDYPSLDEFNVSVSEDERGWRVKFNLKNPRLNGGGPEYLIDRGTGEITDKRIYQ